MTGQRIGPSVTSLQKVLAFMNIICYCQDTSDIYFPSCKVGYRIHKVAYHFKILTTSKLLLKIITTIVDYVALVRISQKLSCMCLHGGKLLKDFWSVLKVRIQSELQIDFNVNTAYKVLFFSIKMS